MVERVRSTKIYGALVAAFLWVFGPQVTHWDHHEDETPDEDAASAIQEKQIAEQAPPPASMPIGNRYVHTEPQNFSRYTPQDDSWWMGMPAVLRDLTEKQNPAV